VIERERERGREGEPAAASLGESSKLGKGAAGRDLWGTVKAKQWRRGLWGTAMAEQLRRGL